MQSTSGTSRSTRARSVFAFSPASTARRPATFTEINRRVRPLWAGSSSRGVGERCSGAFLSRFGAAPALGFFGSCAPSPAAASAPSTPSWSICTLDRPRLAAFGAAGPSAAAPSGGPAAFLGRPLLADFPGVSSSPAGTAGPPSAAPSGGRSAFLGRPLLAGVTVSPAASSAGAAGSSVWEWALRGAMLRAGGTSANSQEMHRGGRRCSAHGPCRALTPQTPAAAPR
mmetsp:Transcript_140042/g.435554  ORF Transcript_140042/g.435554 Transcript_140042/m.435554 type:complete len:227 (-) Transcript_140042:75-755(-)